VGAVERLGLKPKERTAAELLRRTPSTVPELASGARLDARAAELFAYFLVITKIAEIAERVNVSVPRMDTPITVGHARANAMNTLGATLSSGEYVRKMSFSMRAVTGDQNPLRIPSPMPGTLRIPSPMPGTVGTSGSLVPGTGVRRKDAPPATKEKDSPEAEHALSQAEMHFVLGERDQALAFARKALSEAPTMPEAMAFLGYLEAIGLGKDQEDLLRDFLKMIDAALVRDETCRRGRFYRAELKKRLGDHEGAIRDLRLAVTQDPDDAAAQRELKVYEQKVREGALVVRSMSPFGGTPKPVGFLDRLRNK
jgi:tetratricopeptide (TPR) repeat protein